MFLEITGEEAAARRALATALALNQNDAQCRYGLAAADNFLTEPDGEAMDRNCEAALAPSPKDPLAHMFRFVRAYGRLHMHWTWDDPKMRAGFRAAAESPKANYFVHYCAAVACLVDGEPERARAHVAAALARMPSLTVANFWSRFRFKTIDRVMETCAPCEDDLVALGLPRT